MSTLLSRTECQYIVSSSLSSTTSRPQTPPSSRGPLRNTHTPPPRNSYSGSSPTRRTPYAQHLSQTDNDWTSGDVDEDDDETESPEYMYNEGADEDEFGLPSISSMRRAAQKRKPVNKVNDPGGGGPVKIASSLAPERPSSRPRANSSDIAEERGPPIYPSAKRSEGKILRPQYKDILRGMCLDVEKTIAETNRSCEFPPPDRPSYAGPKRKCQGSRGAFDPHLTYQQVQTHFTSYIHISFRPP